MTGDHDIMLESRIHDLLAGRLAEWDRADLLRLVGRDDNARRLMLEMLTLQDRARQAFGLNVEPETMQTFRARTMEALNRRMAAAQVGQAARAGNRPGGDAPAGRRPTNGFDWIVRIAAVLLVGVCGWLAYMLSLATGRPVGQPPRAPVVVAPNGGVAMPALNVDDVATLRKIWDQVRQTGDGARPWVLLSDGVGQFGYLAASAAPAALPAAGTGHDKTGLILVRCMIIGDGKGDSQTRDARQVTQIYLLLPGQQLGGQLAGQPGGQPAAVEFTVPGGVKLGGLAATGGPGSPGSQGQPVDVAIASSGNQVHVNLNVCQTNGVQAGLRGTVVPGQGAVDAGQFQLEGRTFKVLLQAMPLAG